MTRWSRAAGSFATFDGRRRRRCGEPGGLRGGVAGRNRLTATRRSLLLHGSSLVVLGGYWFIA